jgi:hypothetical protein
MRTSSQQIKNKNNDSLDSNDKDKYVYKKENIIIESKFN